MISLCLQLAHDHDLFVTSSMQ